MGLKDVLSRMKIVELAPPAASGPAAGRAPASSDPPDVEALLASLPPPPPIDERALAASAETAGAPGGPAADGDAFQIPDFPSIYRAAGIADPPHGFTAVKVHEILHSPGLEPLDPKAKAAALAGFLKMNPAGPVPIADVVQDAVRRDQALDRFEELLSGKLAARAAEVERQNAALQAEIDELTRRNRELMEANRQALAAEEARIERFRAEKRAEERKLYEAVGPFVDGNPMTAEGAAAPPRPSE